MLFDVSGHRIEWPLINRQVMEFIGCCIQGGVEGFRGEGLGGTWGRRIQETLPSYIDSSPPMFGFSHSTIFTSFTVSSLVYPLPFPPSTFPLSPPLLPSLSDSWWSKNKAGAPPAPRANYPFCQHSNPPGQWTRRARLPAFDQSQSSVRNLDQSQLAEIAAAPSRSLGA